MEGYDASGGALPLNGVPSRYQGMQGGAAGHASNMFRPSQKKVDVAAQQAGQDPGAFFPLESPGQQ